MRTLSPSSAPIDIVLGEVDPLMGHLIPSSIAPFVLPVVYAVVIVAVLPLLAGYIVLLERKVMADMQARLGPMRVGPHGFASSQSLMP